MTDRPNTRPCGSCINLDARQRDGHNFCWRFFKWQKLEDVVVECDKAERANGEPPPGKIWFNGERK